MPTLKRFFIFSCLILCLTFVKISYAEENENQDNLSLNKKLKDSEETILEQDKIQLELKDKVEKLQEENYSLSHALEEKKKEEDELREQLIILKEKIVAKESEKAFLESMVRLQAKDLRQPELVKADEKNLDKVIHLNLGFAYGIKGKTEDAIIEYQKALEYDPDDKDIHYNLGYLLSKENRYKDAIGEYRKALKGLPQDREIYYNLAIIYATGLKDQKTGEEYYQKSLMLSPAHNGFPLQTEEVPQRD